MAKKHFDEYYNQICNQYNSLQLALKELTAEVDSGMIEPERLENLKQTIVPVEDNYRTLSYIKYLLNKPTRDRKVPRYKGANKKLLARSEGRTEFDLYKENENIISTLKL